MFLMMFGALLVLAGILYMVRTAIWWGSLSRPRSSGSVPDTLEPSRGGVRFLGLGGVGPRSELDLTFPERFEVNRDTGHSSRV